MIVSIVYIFPLHFIRFNGVYKRRKALSLQLWIVIPMTRNNALERK